MLALAHRRDVRRFSVRVKSSSAGGGYEDTTTVLYDLESDPTQTNPIIASTDRWQWSDWHSAGGATLYFPRHHDERVDRVGQIFGLACDARRGRENIGITWRVTIKIELHS